MKDRPVLRPTSDLKAMKELATRSGLQEGTLESIVASFGFFEGEALVGCAALKLLEGVFSVECLAVEDAYRGQGLGTELVDAISAEARRRGARRLWALARAPGFFEMIGFIRDESELPGVPTIAGCAECPQYRVSCFPAVFVKEI